MSAALRLATLVALASGCAGGALPVSSPTQAATPPAHDAGLDLARRLPRGADACGVVRSSLLEADERKRYAGVSSAPAIAWHEALGVRAYASVERGRRESTPPAERVWLFVEASEPETRAQLGPALGLDLRWDAANAEPCTPDACPTLARFLGPGLVLIERGPWPEAPPSEGVAGRCRSLVEQHADAVEAWGRRSRTLEGASAESQPLRWTSMVRRVAGGLRVQAEELMPSIEAADRVLAAGGDPTRMASRLGVAAVTARLERVDAAVSSEIELRWEDLELVAADEERAARAHRYAVALGRLVPDDEVEIDALESVAAQIRARLELLENATLPDPEVRESARALIARVRERHPGDSRFDELHARLIELTEAKPPPRTGALDTSGPSP